MYDKSIYLQQQASITPEGFARLVLQTLLDLAPLAGRVSFSEYAEALLDVLLREGHSEHVAVVRDLLIRRGLFEQLRAKDISSYDGTRTEHVLLTGGATVAPWNTYLMVEETAGAAIAVAPAYVQTYLDTGAHSAVSIRAVQRPLASTMFTPTTNDLRYRLYVRRDEPVRYTFDDLTPNRASVDRDAVLEPVITTQTTPHGEVEVATWQLQDLHPGSRYYLHLVNHGTSAGALTGITVQLTSD